MEPKIDRPVLVLGSPLPETPPKRQTASRLLAQFGSQRSPTSVTQLRRSSANTTAPSHALRDRPSISYAISDGSDQSPSPSASSVFTSPEKSQVIDIESSEDELATTEEKKRAVPGVAHCGRHLVKKIGGEKSHKILVSDTLLPPKTTAGHKVETARQRIRSDIAAGTKIKQENFLVAKKEYFLPLLPAQNYVQKLVNTRDGTEPQIVPYKALERQPKGVTATMKPYQLSGLSFLLYLHENGMSGMLGDEMGLGKTLQTLSLFQYLKEQQHVTLSGESRPFLVVCPLSVLSSWVAEARKWTPGLKVLRFHGPVNERKHLKKVASGQEDRYGNVLNRSKKRTASSKPVTDLVEPEVAAGGYDLVVTTYETFQAEQGWFKTAFVWRYVVLDEGHKIKNNLTDISRALQGMQAEHRLILTGTPLQNNLLEMWALLHWLYPQVFAEQSAELFKSSFDLTRGKVNTNVMDDARRLLELIMLRRTKTSPGVDLNLPPKEEVLLYVPLTPMQRFWYTRLLTKADSRLIDELFQDVKIKEVNALRAEAEEDVALAKLQSMQDSQEESDEWRESKEIIRQALEEEQSTIATNKSAWRKLMNLVMQLRKCCNHPYLLPNAAPVPYLVGEHVILASGKFVVLRKILQDLIVEKRKKVLIFSGFTGMLDCTEDLLALIGGNGTDFRYLRLDGQTGRARRNLAIRMFNDRASEYKAMLISTRAGGLGINLASATDVIFLDEDWNPQIMLQAEARAHRIGQTQPVTVYKLCTQGTVEEQMMGRIRKKLYLSAKITESMQNNYGTPTKSNKGRKTAEGVSDDVPQLGTTQLMSLVRRGAQTLSHPEIDATEMLSWDLPTILEKCRDKPSDPHVSEQSASSSSEAEEKKWLSAMEKVECAVFDGRKYQKQLPADDRILSPEITRADRRKDKNTTVMVDGFAINKESMQCADWEAVPTMAGKDPRLAEVKREKKPEIVNQEDCLPKAFEAKIKAFGSTFCPQHSCFDCEKSTSDAGNLIYRCRWCEKGFCEDCLNFDRADLIGETLPEYEAIGFTKPENHAFYIRCHHCRELHEADPEAHAFIDQQEADFRAQHDALFARDQLLAGITAAAAAVPTYTLSGSEEPPSRADSMTEATTVEGSGVSTPRGSEVVLPSRKRKADIGIVDKKIRLKLKMPKLVG
ncbi:hypothetical protein H2199_003577 [Coniosporium tulheliwenetii]|uniref:Uncharacterized protein n=1 Tax=Coniosporium tulheliwenetii TaxID=3383036 RepID=A0ACC2ZAU3_9PEZI|nr:hypothetical protein H2199_003577 [Cladosporium sp. JES 115]